MYIKSLLTAVLLVCFTSTIVSQNLVSPDGSLILLSKSAKLKKAKGWKQDITGDWVSNENAISEVPLNEKGEHLTPQNFKWIQFAHFKNESKDLYALLYESTYYTSSTQSEKRVHYFLMTSKSYAELVAAINRKDRKTFTIHSSTYGYMAESGGEYTAERLMSLIAQSIKNPSRNEYEFSVSANEVNWEDVVRFRLPEQSSITNRSMSDGYFEAKLVEFSEILLPPTAAESSDEEFDLGRAITATTGKQAAMPQIEDRTPVARENIASVNATPTKNERITTANEPTVANDTFDRADKEEATVSEPISVLSNIESWYYNNEGKWVNDKDVSFRFETVGKYEIRNFNYRNKNYLLLVRYEKYAGASYYLVTKDDYADAVANMANSSIIRFPIVAYGKIGNTLEDMIEISEKAIDMPKRENTVVFKQSKIVLQYKMSETKGIARFFLFEEECSKYGSESASENCSAKTSKKIKYDDVPYLGTEKLFNKMYYETKYLDFITFLQRPLPKTARSMPQKNTDIW